MCTVYKGLSIKVSFMLIGLPLSVSIVCAQPTVGLLRWSESSQLGYHLLTPRTNTNVYLIDNCGREIHEWRLNSLSGERSYLLPNGNLMRAEKIDSRFRLGGGHGGRLVLYDQKSEELGSYLLMNDSMQQHHDFVVLPNGNILCMLWITHPIQEVIDLGRDRNLLVGEGLWSERIVELQLYDQNSFSIVWQWDAFDHLVQDIDSSRRNFGTIVDHPERIDINYATGVSVEPSDWLHFNSITYNEALDQIMVSARSFNEIWVIDHSTSTEEAVGSTGGEMGKGGDLLYRWGNPEAYDRGETIDRKFFFQHAGTWMENGRIMVFNNGADGIRPFSSIDIFEPSIDVSGDYMQNEYGQFLPLSFSWSYSDSSHFYSPFMSSVQELDNGNILACLGISGRILEINEEKEIVWEYINPVDPFGPVTQGATTTGRSLFRADKYSTDYEGLISFNLHPGPPLEKNPIPYVCDGMLVNSVEKGIKSKKLTIYPNPTSNYLSLDLDDRILETKYKIYDKLGRLILEGYISLNRQIDIREIKRGLYILVVGNNIKKFIISKK